MVLNLESPKGIIIAVCCHLEWLRSTNTAGHSRDHCPLLCCDRLLVGSGLGASQFGVRINGVLDGKVEGLDFEDISATCL